MTNSVTKKEFINAITAPYSVTIKGGKFLDATVKLDQLSFATKVGYQNGADLVSEFEFRNAEYQRNLILFAAYNHFDIPSDTDVWMDAIDENVSFKTVVESARAAVKKLCFMNTIASQKVGINFIDGIIRNLNREADNKAEALEQLAVFNGVLEQAEDIVTDCARGYGF